MYKIERCSFFQNDEFLCPDKKTNVASYTDDTVYTDTIFLCPDKKTNVASSTDDTVYTDTIFYM